MNFFTSYRKDFFITIAIGTTLVFLIILLGASFFNAIISTETSSKKEILRKQTELAAIGLELELNKFEESSALLMEYLEDVDLDEEDYRQEFTDAVKRVFKNYPSLIDTVFVDLKDSSLYFTQTLRNDFIRKKSIVDFPELNHSRILLEIHGKIKPFKILFYLNPTAFSKYFVENFYIGTKGIKLLYLNGEFSNLDGNEDQEFILGESEIKNRILADLKIGVLGVYEADWNSNGKSKKGILTQYPFNFGSLSNDASLLIIGESESIVTSIGTTYFLLYVGLIALIIGTVILFALSLKNNLESQRLFSENAAELSELFDQQNLLLKELKGFVFFHDAKGKVTRVSDEVSEVLGIPKSTFIEAFNEREHQKDVMSIRVLVRKALIDRKTNIDFKYDFTSIDNRRIHLRIFEKLVFDQDGSFTGGIGICTDITKSYIARQELVQSEKRLRTLIENIPDFLFIYDNDGVIIDYQLQVPKKFIEDKFKLKGRIFSEVIPKNQVEHLLAAFKLARKTGKMQSADLRTRIESEEKFFEVKIFPLDEHKMMSISKDITDQRIWEKGLLEAVNAADQASKAKSEFLANMSHEIITPMNGLLGIIELLEQTKLDETQLEYMNIIKNSGNSLLTIIKDILDYSKIESGIIEIHSRVFVPKSEFQKQVQILSGLAKKKNIELLTTFSELTENTFEGDLGKLMQVFLNLTGNAIKFTPQNGSIHITVGIESIMDELWQLSVSVKDSGIGIPDELIPSLTNPFYQVESSSSRTYQGTGLGLAISKKLIELIGGELMIASRVNEGSEFTFTALLKEVKIQQQKLNEVSALNPQSWIGMALNYPLRILLAEDNDLNLQLMNLMLSQLGYDFEVAKNGREAVELATEQVFDLILMDVQMPVLNGLEATSLIRKIPSTSSVYIIGLSANVFDEDQKKAIESGMNDYLTKPIRLGALAEKLKNCSVELSSKLR